jgi:hypothetical protein
LSANVVSEAPNGATSLFESPNECQHCGQPFAKRESSGGSPQRFCSAQCRQASHANGQRGQHSPACDAATRPPATPTADPVKAATEACEARIATLLGKQPEEQFDWIKDDSIILEKQLPIAIYLNRRDHVVIRQEGNADEEDAFVIIAPQNIQEFIDRLCDVAGVPALGRS